jgi:hypothetical protein
MTDTVSENSTKYLQFAAKEKALERAPRARAISRTSGGTGKNDDSIKERINSAIGP